MGMIVFPVFRDGLPGPPPTTTGEFLPGSIESLEAIAEQRGLCPLSTFFDSRPIPEDFDGSPSDLDALLGPCDEWHPARAGTAALHALAEAVRSTLSDDDALEDADLIIAELEDLARVLWIAGERGAEFRLEMR